MQLDRMVDAPADTGSSEVDKQYDLARRNVVEGVDDVAFSASEEFLFTQSTHGE